MFMPFVVIPFNLLSAIKTGTIYTFADVLGFVSFPTFGAVSTSVNGVFTYLVATLFGYTGVLATFIENCLTYWVCTALIWLVFDVLIFLPFICHNLIDKAVSKVR